VKTWRIHLLGICLLMGLSLVSIAAEAPISIRFGGGINRNGSSFALKPYEATEIINFNIGPGWIEKREGFSVLTRANNTISGLYGFRLRSGEEQLMEVVDSGSYSILLEGDTSGMSQKYDRLFKGGPFNFLTWRDAVYIMDGRNYPVVADTLHTISLYVPPPGGMNPIIVNQTSVLNGKYQYMRLPKSSDLNTEYHTALRSGFPSQMISVSNNCVYIPFWTNTLTHGFCGSKRGIYGSGNDCVVDTLASVIYRKRVDSTREELGWLCLDTNVRGDYFDTGYTGFTPTGHYIIDTWGFLGNHFGHTLARLSRPYGGDSLHLTYSYIDCGSPLIHTLNLGNANTLYGSYTIRWALTCVDTLTGVESQLGPPLIYVADVGYYMTGDTTLVNLRIPRPPSGYVFNLYRSDSSGSIYYRIKGGIGYTEDDEFLLYNDTTSIIWAMANCSTYASGTATRRFIGGITWDDRFYGWDGGTNLYYSVKDTAKFGLEDYIALGADDGFGITTVIPDRDHLLVYKPNSRHEVYEDASGGFTRTSPPYYVSGVGCIAGQSMVQWRGARIYLSQFGVVYETGNEYLDKGNQIDTISMGIDPVLSAFSYSERSRAVGHVFDNNRYFLSIPGHDTTFVCFLDLPGFPWAIYTPFSFAAATEYGGNGDSSIFCRAGSDSIFRWGGAVTDAGKHFSAKYRTGDFLLGTGLYDLERMFLTMQSGDVNGQMTVRFRSEAGDTLGYLVVPDSSARIGRWTVGTGKPNGAFSFEIVADSLTDSLRVEALDVFWKYVADGLWR
jgi:hypothetical protein